MIDGRGALTRIPPIFGEVFGGTDAMRPGRADRAAADAATDAPHRRFAVRPHELDPMDHVNNAVYLDWLEESGRSTPRRPTAPSRGAIAIALPRRYRLEFALAADAGAELDGAAWRDGARLELPPGRRRPTGSTGSGRVLDAGVDGREPRTGGAMTRTVLRGGRVFDGTGSDPARGRRRDRGRPDRRRRHRPRRRRRGRRPRPDDPARPVRLPRPRLHLERRPVGPRPAAVLAASSTRRRRTSGRRSRSGSRRSATPAAPTSGSSRPSPTGTIAGPRLQISIIMLSQTGGHGDDWYPSGAEVPFMGAAPGPPVRRSSTAPTRSGARSASSIAPGPTSSRSRRRAASCRPRRPAPRPLPAGRARGARRGGDRGRACSSWPMPRAPTGSRTRSGPGSARSSTGSTSTTRRSS